MMMLKTLTKEGRMTILEPKMNVEIFVCIFFFVADHQSPGTTPQNHRKAHLQCRSLI